MKQFQQYHNSDNPIINHYQVHSKDDYDHAHLEFIHHIHLPKVLSSKMHLKTAKYSR